jgi:hypothetical protein
MVFAHVSLIGDTEPTSGLDTNVAFEVMSAVKRMVVSQRGKVSVGLTIHQPNAQIMSLFDDILILGHGGMTYFGTYKDAIAYITSIGFPPPGGIASPIDYFLDCMDASGLNYFDFESAYGSSENYSVLMADLRKLAECGEVDLFKSVFDGIGNDEEASGGIHNVSAEFLVKITGGDEHNYFFNEFMVLLNRVFQIAIRSITLYFAHFIIVLITGLLFGITFYQTKYIIDESKDDVPLAILLMLNTCIYVQIFKIPHLVRSYQIFLHERHNDVYGVAAPLLAEFVAAVFFTICYFPGCLAHYATVGLPFQAFGQILLIISLVSDWLCCYFRS